VGRWVVPRTTDAVLREGDHGIVVWALQRQCQRLVSEPGQADGVFGRNTETAVIMLQGLLGVEADGICGYQTQKALARYFADRATGLPRDMLLSLMSYESSCLLGAVNWHSEGGVDCGVTQRRVIEARLNDDATLQLAFDASYQIHLAAATLSERFDVYRMRVGTAASVELAWRTAVLYHNYPALAEKISYVGRFGLSAYYTSPQAWVESVGLHFPDGTPIRTPLQWGERYSLGNARHMEPGQAVKLVRDWTP
jgi:hypothetical protein